MFRLVARFWSADVHVRIRNARDLMSDAPGSADGSLGCLMPQAAQLTVHISREAAVFVPIKFLASLSTLRV